MHQMCWLYNEVLYAIVNRSLQCLIHIVDLLTITSLYMIDNDLCCKCSSYRPVRICCLDCFLNTTDICRTAVIEGCSKTYYKDFIFTDLISIERIILGCISCISSEIIRIRILSLNKFFLCICQCIPCFFRCCTLLICLVCSFLNINVIDQLRNFICCFLITVLFRLCLCCVSVVVAL